MLVTRRNLSARAAVALLVGAALLGSTEAHSAQPSKAVVAALCGERTPCQLASAHDAGTDKQSRRLIVVRLELVAGEVDLVEDGNGGEEGHPERAYEYWLARLKDDGLESRQLLFRHEPTPMSHQSTHSFRVEPNRFVHGVYTIAPVRSSREEVVELSPLRRHSSSSTAFQGASVETTSWNWRSGRGHGTVSVPTCGLPNTMLEQPSGESTRYAAIPVIDLEQSWREGGWRTIGMNACGVEIDSRAKGFVVHGTPSKSNDARLRAVLASPTELYVEVIDDHWVTSADRWIWQDHVEVWLGGAMGASMTCLPKDQRPVQWGVLLDATVLPAHGAPRQALKAKSARFDKDGKLHTVRLRIELPKPVSTITLVYSDSDDGRSQERLIATSQLAFGEQASLGKVEYVSKREAVCAVDEGTLQYNYVGKFEPDRPVLW